MPYRRYDFSNVGENCVRNLRSHPLNERIYGSTEPDDGLLASVKEHGVFNPIVVNRKKEILSGTRRWLASKAAGYDKIPNIVLIEKEPGGILSELFLIESNRQRQKTKEQRVNEAIELERIKAALAKQRLVTSTGGANPQPLVNLPKAEKVNARDQAAKEAGISVNDYRKLKPVVQKAREGDSKARQVMDEVNAGTRSVDSAFKQVTAQKTESGLSARQKQFRGIAGSAIARMRSLINLINAPDTSEEEYAWMLNESFKIIEINKEFAAVAQGERPAFQRGDGG